MARIGALLSGTSLLLTLNMGAALAGPCTGQIVEVEAMARTSGTSAGATTGSIQNQAGTSGAQPATAPGISAAKSIIPAPGSTLEGEAARVGQGPAGAGAAASTGSTASPGGTGPQAGAAPSVSSTKAMTGAPSDTPGVNPPAAGAMTGTLATSPQDVAAQQQGQPTAVQAGTQQLAGQQAGGSNPQLLTALNNARQFDLQGNASECTNALNEARRLIGSR